MGGRTAAWAAARPATLTELLASRRTAVATPLVPPTSLSPDLVLQIRSLLEALDRARPALRAADPLGQLWASCHAFMQHARRFGIGAPGARIARAQTERRLAELAEQAGDLPAAILHYRAALASQASVGVKRRLALLARHWPTATAGPDAAPVTSGPDRVGRSDVARSPSEARMKQAAKKKARAQIVAQIDAEVAARMDNAKQFAYYPVAVLKSVDHFSNGSISLKFKTIAGESDRCSGILFNVKPNGDWLAVRYISGS